MGLDLSPGAVRWSYSGFHRFRGKLAAAIGAELEELWLTHPFSTRDPSELPPYEDDDDAEWHICRKESDSYCYRLQPGDDPLLLLLIHSDCDGILTPEECRVLGPRLCEVVSAWPEDDDDRDMGLKLAQSCCSCAEWRTWLKFH